MLRSLSWLARLVLPICSAASAALAIAVTPGTTTLTGRTNVCVTGEAAGPKVAVIVATSVLLSGVETSGTSVTVSLADWPGASEEIGARPLIVSPLASVAVRSMLSSSTLPKLVIVIVSVTGTPGVAFSVVGVLGTLTASIAGTVKVSVCV